MSNLKNVKKSIMTNKMRKILHEHIRDNASYTKKNN